MSGAREDAPVGAVLVAAGLSSRMGAFKPLLPLAGSTMIGTAVDNLRRGGVERIIAVTGFRADELEPYLDGLGVEHVRNEAYASTQMFDSIKIGLAALGKCRKVAIMPADNPLIRPETVAALIDADFDAVQPEYRGRGGHPIIVSARAVPIILAHDGRDGLRGALEKLSPMRIPVEDAGIDMDADTREEYKAILNFSEDRENE